MLSACSALFSSLFFSDDDGTVTMWKQSSSRNHRGKRLRLAHYLQLFLLVAVSTWLVYQLGQCYGKRRAVAVEISGSRGVDGELIRRHQFGRKGLVEFAGDSSGEDAPGISGAGTIARNDEAIEWEQKSSKDKDREDEDEDGLVGYDDTDEGDFPLDNGEGEENSELDRSAVHRVNTTGRAREDGALLLLNAASDGGDKAAERNRLVNSSILSKNSSSGLFLNDSS